MKSSVLKKIELAVGVVGGLFLVLTIVGVVSLVALLWEEVIPGAGVGLLRSAGMGGFLFGLAAVLGYFRKRKEESEGDAS